MSRPRTSEEVKGQMGVTKKVELSELQSLTTALPTYCAAMTFMVDSTTYTTPQVVQLGTGLLAAASAVVQAKAAYAEAVAKERKLQATDGAILSVVRVNLAGALASSPTTLAALGVTPRKKPAPLSPSALAARAAKAEATRKARGTASKKQKATVTGDVSGVTITPVVTGPTASAATPAAPVPIQSSAVSTAAGTGGVSHS